MGRLRTAVRTLADVDLPPDELLTHLDDLVIHLSGNERDTDRRRGTDDRRPPAESAPPACTRSTTRSPAAARSPGRPPAARPGHPRTAGADLSAARRPARSAVGGLPFEATELELPEGSVLALYTDGLLDARDRDIDDGARPSCATRPGRPGRVTLDSACDTVLRTLPPDRPADDVALLLARTRAWPPTRSPPGTSPPTRPWSPRPASRPSSSSTPGGWRRRFITELVVSELVTNAIRYGAAADPAAADPRPHADLRGLRRQQHRPASAPRPHLRRGRPRPAAGRPAHPALGHPPDHHGQDHLVRAAAAPDMTAPGGPVGAPNRCVTFCCSLTAIIHDLSRYGAAHP